MPRPVPLPQALSGQPFTVKQAQAAGLTRRRCRAQTWPARATASAFRLRPT